MNYKRLCEAIFLNRENRFIANVELNGEKVRVHVPNTGRCEELFISGRRVLLEGADPARIRKTPYSLVSIDKDDMWVNIDSQAPNQLVAEYLKTHPILKGFGRILDFKREVTHGDSRFDFYVLGDSGEGYMEVKGVTLEINGHAKFPDAPTSRGEKHVRELGDMASSGQCAAVFFVIQMKGPFAFSPNKACDPKFTSTLLQAKKRGLHIFIMDTMIRGGHMTIHRPVVFYGEDSLEMRLATHKDLEAIMEMIAESRESLKEDGVDQWQGADPTEESVREDISSKRMYIFEDGGIVGAAVLLEEEEKTYREIEGEWLNDVPYVTIHRFMVSKKRRGEKISKRMMHEIKCFVVSKAFNNIRIDTHRDNFRMRGLIESSDFKHCGVIRLSDNSERLAYQWSRQ